MPSIDNDYDRAAYKQLLRTSSTKPGPLSRLGTRLAGAASAAGSRVSDRVPEALNDATAQALRIALEGLRATTLDPAMRSVRTSRVLRAYGATEAAPADLTAIRKLPLATIDRVVPSLSFRYSLAAAAEGAGAGIAITGGEVVAATGVAAAPGAGVVIGAMAFDAATVLAASGRVIAHTAAYYGYDTRLPDEQVFALAIMNWSEARGEAAKSVAFAQLSRVSQQLARNATWKQLDEFVLVKVINKLFVRLGFRLTKLKLGQALPVAGAVIGAGLNAALLRAIADDARTAYRMRHLTEKYGVTFTSGETTADAAVFADVVDVEGAIAEAVEGS